MKLPAITLAGGTGKEVETALFDRVAGKAIVAQAVRVYLSNQRQGTAKTKNRSEVDLTKTKWFKQKGTGRARHGAQSAPIFVGGGVTHGPRGNANWKLTMSKTMKRVALKTAFGLQSQAGNVIIAHDLEKASGKTKEMAAFLEKNELTTKAILVITDKPATDMVRACRNLENVLLCSADNVTTYYVMRAGKILFTPEGLQALEARLADGKPVSVRVSAVVEEKSGEKKSKIKSAPKKVAEKTVQKVAKKVVTKKDATK